MFDPEKPPVNAPISPADRFAILDLIAAYNLAADVKDIEATVGYYTADGQIEGDMRTGKGHAGLRADLPDIFAAEPGLKRHLANNVQFLGRTADGEVEARYVLLVMEASAITLSIATSLVTDRFREVDGTWKVAHHHVAIDPSARWMVKAGQQVQQAIKSVKEALG